MGGAHGAAPVPQLRELRALLGDAALEVALPPELPPELLLLLVEGRGEVRAMRPPAWGVLEHHGWAAERRSQGPRQGREGVPKLEPPHPRRMKCSRQRVGR